MVSRGFTLIELMVVMAIVGILSSLIIPFTVEQVEKTQVKQEIQELHLLLKQIKGETFAKGKAVQLGFYSNTMSLGESDVVFDALRFPEQTLNVSKMGVVTPSLLEFRISGETRILDISSANYREIK